MANDFVTVVFKNRKRVEVPRVNLNNTKRIFANQIDYIDDGSDEPILARPVVEVVKDDEPILAKTTASMDMTKPELTALAENLEGYNPKMNKKQLVDLINE